MSSTHHFDALVLAGGGCRCMWQVGFIEATREQLTIAPRFVSCVSAGSAMATMLFGGRVAETLDFFKALTAENDKNAYFDWEHLVGVQPVFPHLRMYSETLLSALDEQAIDRLAQGPTIAVLVARPPRFLPKPAALLVGFASYLAERRLHDRVHPSWAQQLGYEPELFTIHETIAAHRAAGPRAVAEAITELVLASSCSPPLTPFFRFRGRLVLDGGLVDNVPSFAVPGDCEHTLVLLTRRYAPEKIAAAARPGEWIVQPSEPIPVEKWDYTNPEGVQATYDLGRRDGERFAREVR